MQRFRSKLVAGTAAEFVAAKLAERDERHKRMGDSRYLVEPNVKDGKGGLRDLHALYWIGKYVHGVEEPADWCAQACSAPPSSGASSAPSASSGRCAATPSVGRPRRGKARLRPPEADCASHALRRPAGEIRGRALHAILFLNAKAVGDLTGVFLAQLDEQLGRKGTRFALPTIRRRPRRLAGFVLDRGRLSIPGDDYFAKEPVRLIELFALAAREQLEIHPAAMRAASRDARLIDEKVRRDPRAMRCSSRC